MPDRDLQLAAVDHLLELLGERAEGNEPLLALGALGTERVELGLRELQGRGDSVGGRAVGVLVVRARGEVGVALREVCTDPRERRLGGDVALMDPEAVAAGAEQAEGGEGEERFRGAHGESARKRRAFVAAPRISRSFKRCAPRRAGRGVRAGGSDWGAKGPGEGAAFAARAS